MNTIAQTIKRLQLAEFDPFSRKCKIEKIREQFEFVSRKIAGTEDEEEKQKWISILDLYVVADVMYEMAKDFHRFMDRTVPHANFSYEELLYIQLSGYNLRYQNSIKQQIEEIKKRKTQEDVLPYYEVYNSYSDSQLLDSVTDSLAFFLKYLSHYENIPFSKDMTVQQITSLRNLPDYVYRSYLYNVRKYAYDQIRWKSGRAEINRNKYPFEISISLDEDELKHEEANRHLLQSEVYNEQLKINKKELFAWLGSDQFAKRISSVRCENGYVIPELEKGDDPDLENCACAQYAFFRVCYPFNSEFEFPAFPELTMEKCLAIYIAFNQLMAHISVMPVDRKKDDWEKIYQTPFRFQKKVLINYLVEKTAFERGLVEQFLTLYSTDTLKNITIWNTPLLSYKDDYLFFLYAAVNGMTINLMDCWLEKAGYDLEKRGPAFEEYVRNFLAKAVGQSTKYPCYLYPQKNYNYAKTKKEQIDLIFRAGNKLFVCEAKCIRYAMEPYNQYCMLNRLTEGCEQAIKKADFIRTHTSVLGDISGLEIVPLVITNNLLYSGFVRDGVQIVDIKRLVSYIYPHTDKVKRICNGKEESVVEYPNYTNQQEFNENIFSYLHLPPDVKMIKEKMKAGMQQMGNDMGSYDLYCMQAYMEE